MIPRLIPAYKLKLGDRFNFIPAAWHGPGVITESYGTRCVLPAFLVEYGNKVTGSWTLKFDNDKVVNPPGVWYGYPDTEVELLGRRRKRV